MFLDLEMTFIVFKTFKIQVLHANRNLSTCIPLRCRILVAFFLKMIKTYQFFGEYELVLIKTWGQALLQLRALEPLHYKDKYPQRRYKWLCNGLKLSSYNALLLKVKVMGYRWFLVFVLIKCKSYFIFLLIYIKRDIWLCWYLKGFIILRELLVFFP